jgi:hypothetical protein
MGSWPRACEGARDDVRRTAVKLHRTTRGEVAAEQAVALKDRLVPVVESGVHRGAAQAAYAAGAAKEWAQPRLEKGWEKTLEAAAPRVEAAADKVTPAVDATRDKLVDDLIPRIVEAVAAAAAAAAAAKASAEDTASHAVTVAGRRKDEALAHLPGQARKRRAARRRKLVLFSLIGAAIAAGAAAFARSRTPQEPWTSAPEPTGSPLAAPGAAATSAGPLNAEAVVSEIPAELAEEPASVIDLDEESSSSTGFPPNPPRP